MNSDKTKENFRKNAIIALLAIIAIGLISLIIYNKLNKKDVKLLELDELSYKETTFFNVDSLYDLDFSTGIVELEGYAEVVNRQIPEITDDNYVFFHIINSSSSEFLHYLESIKAVDENEYYSRNDAIGIGCLEDKAISMTRYADKYINDESLLKFDLSIEDSQAILFSSKDKPVKIIVRKDLYTSLVGDIQGCKTLITSVELVK